MKAGEVKFHHTPINQHVVVQRLEMLCKNWNFIWTECPDSPRTAFHVQIMKRS